MESHELKSKKSQIIQIQILLDLIFFLEASLTWQGIETWSSLWQVEIFTPFVKLTSCVMVMSFETSFSTLKPLPMYTKKILYFSVRNHSANMIPDCLTASD